MPDLGNSFLSSVAREPNALALVDGSVRFTYEQWYRCISEVIRGLDELDIVSGDHLITVLQNRWEAATLHWACQIAGIVVTPVNWRAKSAEIDHAIQDSEAQAIVFEDASAAAVRNSEGAKGCIQIALESNQGAEIDFQGLRLSGGDVTPRASAESWSVMLYTSGTTGKPKGVPRRQRAERAAAIAHVGQMRFKRIRVPGEEAIDVAGLLRRATTDWRSALKPARD